MTDLPDPFAPAPQAPHPQPPLTGVPAPPQPHQPNKHQVAQVMHKRYCGELNMALRFEGWRVTWVSLLVYGEESETGPWDEQHLLQLLSHLRSAYKDYWRQMARKCIQEPPEFEYYLQERQRAKRNQPRRQTDRDSVLRATGRVVPDKRDKDMALPVGEVAGKVTDAIKQMRKAIE